MTERIVFFGRNRGYDLTLLCFRELLKYLKGSGHRLAAVIVSDDNHGRHNTLQEMAENNHVKWMSAKSNNVNSPYFVAMISKLKPTIFIVVQFPRIFSAGLLGIPERAAFNLHRGWPIRGGSIDERAIYCRLPVYNMALHHIDRGIDSGNIVGKIGFKLNAKEDGYSLVRKSDKTGLAVFRKYFLPIIGNKVPAGKKQDLTKTAYGAKGSISNEIDLSMSSDRIERLCRAFYHPRKSGAFIRIRGKNIYLIPPVKIISKAAQVTSGEVVSLNKTAGVLATGDSMISVTNCRINSGNVGPFGQVLIHNGIQPRDRLKT